MKIVYLDEPTFLPEEWHERFRRLGEVEVFDDRPDAETAVQRLCTSDLAIVEWTHLPAQVLSRVRRLRYLTLMTTSFDTINLAAARAAGITVAHCPTYSSQSVAEHVFGLLLAVIRRLRAADVAVRRGVSHCYGPFLGMELAGRTIGLLGTGRIARAVARVAAGFGMRVAATNRTGAPVAGMTVVPLDDLLHCSDVLSLHVPLDRSTRGLLDGDRLARLRPGAIVINTCRADLVDQVALAAMLADGRLGGAGLDDLAEPAAADIRTLENVVLTPGTAWYTDAARVANLVEAYDNLASFLAGRPINVLAYGCTDREARGESRVVVRHPPTGWGE